jgi:uncharacterized protein YceK
MKYIALALTALLALSGCATYEYRDGYQQQYYGHDRDRNADGDHSGGTVTPD